MPMREKKNKENGKPEETAKPEPNFTVVKLSLKKVIKDALIYEKIQKDVLEMSSLAVEASFQIKYELIKVLEGNVFDGENIKFRDYFYRLIETKKHKPSSEYQELRKTFNLPLYDKAYRSRLYCGLAEKYTTKFEKNLSEHGYNRVKKYLAKLNKLNIKKSGTILYQNLQWLFQKGAPEPERKLQVLPWTKGHFMNLKLRCYELLPDFFEIFKTNILCKWKNFELFPTFKYGRKHLDYEFRSFYELLCSVGLCPKKLTRKHNKEVNKTYKEFTASVDWKEYLNLPRNLKFKSFSTDGISCSVFFEKGIKKQKVENNFYFQPTKTNIGIDPGWKLFLAAVRSTNGDPYNYQNLENIKYSSAQYNRESGYYSRKYKLEKYTKNIEKQIIKDREEWSKSSNVTDWFLNYIYMNIYFPLKWITVKQKIYSQAKVSRLRFDAYLRKKKLLKKLIDEKLVKGEEKVTIFWGDAKQSNDCGIKGYIRSPGLQLEKQLKKHPKIQLVTCSEYNTTKKCARCLDYHTISKPPHRYSFCRKCCIVWNRDINASQNILQLGFQKYIKNNSLYSLR